MSTQIQLRRDTAANWTANNPTLAAGEVGYDTTSRRFKVGDGITGWNTLDWFPGVGQVQGAYKTADTVRNNTGVLAADPHLVLPLKAGEVWSVVGHLYLIGATAPPDVQVNFSVPVGSTARQSIQGHVLGVATAGVGSDLKSGTVAVGTALTAGVGTDETYAMVTALIEVGGSNGNTSLQWAQASATAVNTTLRRGSHLIGTRLA